MRLKFDVTGEDIFREDFTVDFEKLSGLMSPLMEFHGLGRYEEISVSLSFIDEEGIRTLNKQYRNIDESTDVLSFPLWEEAGVFLPPEGWPELPLGDVIVSPPCVRENAKNQEVDYNNEIVLVIVHGVLHLIGYDHDTEERKTGMWREQEALVREYLERIQGGLMSE